MSGVIGVLKDTPNDTKPDATPPTSRRGHDTKNDTNDTMALTEGDGGHNGAVR